MPRRSRGGAAGTQRPKRASAVRTTRRDAAARADAADETAVEFLVAELSGAVLRATADEVDGEIERWLRRLVEGAGVDRASIVQPAPGRPGAMVATHSQAIEGVWAGPRTILSSQIPWFLDQGRRGRVVRLERIPEDLPPEAVAERAYTEETRLKSYLAIPIAVSGELLGGLILVSLRTHRAWPEPLVEHLRRAAELIGMALARKRDHAALQARLSFERLIADLVQSLVTAPASELDARIQDGLQQVVGHFGVDRVSFGRFADDGTALVTHQARVDGIPELPATIARPGYHAELLKGRTVQFSRIPADVPEGWAEERAELVRAGIRSMLGIPLAVGGRVWGGIGFAALSRSQQWTEEEIQRLGLLGRILMEAVRRREFEREERRAGQALAERVEFEEFLSRLSTAFAALPTREVNDQIERWLGRLVAFLAVHRGSLLQFPVDESVLHETHSHAVAHAPRIPTVVSRNEFPWYMAEVSRGRVIRLEALPDELPPQAHLERAYAGRTGLKALLVLPLSFDGAPLGALAFASGTPRAWPEALVSRLELVAQVFAGALGRSRARRDLEERLGFERLITDLVKAFVSVSGAQLDTEIEHGLNQLIRHFGVEGASLRRLSEDGQRLIATHSVRAHGIPHSPSFMDTPWYLGEVKVGRIVHLNGLAEDLPPEAGRERQFGRGIGMRSHLAIPLVADGRIWGTIGFSSFRSPRRWTDQQAQRLRLVGEIMMEAVRRHEEAVAAGWQRDELVHMARVGALGELTAALAHELNQPLATIQTNAQVTRRLLAAGRAPMDLDEVLGDIATAAARAADLIRRLRNLLRRRQLEKVPLEMNSMLRDVQSFLLTEVKRHGCGLTCHLAEGLPKVAGDAVQLQQVLLNLARNAAESMSGGNGGAREVVVRTAHRADGQVTVSVEDSGPPIDDAALDQMFTPFHSTKPDGLGMGLAISHSIIEAHAGRLWAERRREGGLAVQFALPVSREGGA